MTIPPTPANLRGLSTVICNIDADSARALLCQAAERIELLETGMAQFRDELTDMRGRLRKLGYDPAVSRGYFDVQVEGERSERGDGERGDDGQGDGDRGDERGDEERDDDGRGDDGRGERRDDERGDGRSADSNAIGNADPHSQSIYIWRGLDNHCSFSFMSPGPGVTVQRFKIEAAKGLRLVSNPHVGVLLERTDGYIYTAADVLEHAMYGQRGFKVVGKHVVAR